MLQGLFWIFEQEEKFAAEKCAEGGRGDHPPSIEVRDRVADRSPQLQVEPKRESVRNGFKQKMRMDGVRADVQINREGHGGV